MGAVESTLRDTVCSGINAASNGSGGTKIAEAVNAAPAVAVKIVVSAAEV